MAPPLTVEERARICDLYRAWRDSGQRNQTRHRAIEKIAAQVNRGWVSVHQVLVAERLIPAPRPRGLSDRFMKKVAEAYRSAGWSLRECAREFKLSYGVVRAVLAYEGVELRGRGGAGRVARRPDGRGPGGCSAAVVDESDRCTVDDVPDREANARPSRIRS